MLLLSLSSSEFLLLLISVKQPLDIYIVEHTINKRLILILIQQLHVKGPTFPKPLKSPEDLSRLDPNVDVRKKMNFLFDAITMTRHELEGKCPLFGFSGAPVS